MENKKYNEIISNELSCEDGDSFVVKCDYTVMEQSKDYKYIFNYLYKHIREIHLEDVRVELDKRVSVNVNGSVIGYIDVPLIVFQINVQNIEHPKSKADKAWNKYVSAYLEGDSLKILKARRDFLTLMEQEK